MTGGRQVGLQALQQGQRQRADRPAEQIALEQRLDSGRNHRRQPLTRLEQYVADETITHHYVSFPPVQPVTFDIANVVKPRGRLQKTGSTLDLLIALDVLSAHIEQGHSGRCDTEDLGKHRAHHCKLIERLGAAIDVRPQVQQLAMT